MIKNNKMRKMIDGYSISVEHKGTKKQALVARDRNGHIKSKKLIPGKLPKDINGLLISFKNDRDFTPFKKKLKEPGFIKEHHTYKNGFKQIGIFSKDSVSLPPKPDNDLTVFMVMARLRNGKKIYASSRKMASNNLTLSMARAEAMINLYDVVTDYAENSQEEFNQLKREGHISSIHEGWTYYVRSPKRQKARPR